jgi:hypothetical protein
LQAVRGRRRTKPAHAVLRAAIVRSRAGVAGGPAGIVQGDADAGRAAATATLFVRGAVVAVGRALIVRAFAVDARKRAAVGTAQARFTRQGAIARTGAAFVRAARSGTGAAGTAARRRASGAAGVQRSGRARASPRRSEACLGSRARASLVAVAVRRASITASSKEESRNESRRAEKDGRPPLECPLTGICLHLP